MENLFNNKVDIAAGGGPGSEKPHPSLLRSTKDVMVDLQAAQDTVDRITAFFRSKNWRLTD